MFKGSDELTVKAYTGDFLEWSFKTKTASFPNRKILIYTKIPIRISHGRSLLNKKATVYSIAGCLVTENIMNEAMKHIFNDMQHGCICKNCPSFFSMIKWFR